MSRSARRIFYFVSLCLFTLSFRLTFDFFLATVLQATSCSPLRRQFEPVDVDRDYRRRHSDHQRQELPATWLSARYSADWRRRVPGGRRKQLDQSADSVHGAGGHGCRAPVERDHEGVHLVDRVECWWARVAGVPLFVYSAQHHGFLSDHLSSCRCVVSSPRRLDLHSEVLLLTVPCRANTRAFFSNSVHDHNSRLQFRLGGCGLHVCDL